MKATKKIVGAACALVAAVALSAGSTFAWFATNDKVTVTGMKVEATVPTNLYIAKGYVTSADSVNDPSIDYAETKATKLSPAAISSTATAPDATLPAALTDGKFYVLDAATYTTDPTTTNPGEAATYKTIDTLTATIEGATPGVTEASTDKDWAKYVYKQDMTLANKSTETNVNATVTLSFEADSTDTWKFIRVGFVIGDGTGYKLISQANTSATLTTEGDATVTPKVPSELKFEYTNLIENFPTNTVQTVSFLVWFDGDDADCYVNNALDVSTFDVSILYQAVASVSGGTGD